MTSPFPGMNPYLEDPAFWSDFHATFINYWREAIADQLPGNYDARIDERVNLVELPAEKIRRFEPDVAVTHRPSPRAAQSIPTTSGVATLDPFTVPLPIEEEYRETYIQILHRPDRTLVAVLELLSPSNKQEPGRSTYLAKRNALLHHDVHLVELDLLLKGQRLPLKGEYPPGDYLALVSRADQRPNCHVYAWQMAHRLPWIPIPLRDPDPDLFIDLSTVFGITFEKGRYAGSLDYSRPPNLTVDEESRRWIASQVAGQA